MAAMLNFRPKSSLIDSITKISVARLKPGQKVTLAASIVGDLSETFESHGHYIANQDGEVDVCRDPSFGGSYSGVEPMGLFWSMKQAPGQRRGTRFVKRDVSKPLNVVVNCFDSHITPNEASSQPVTSATFEKWYMADGVNRVPVSEGRIRGTLFIPPGKGPFPGVIDLVGSGRGLLESKASLLASHGFAALALDYVKLPEARQNMPMEYFEEAANWLSMHLDVISHGTGVHSICYGSWVALLMASLQMKAVKAVVAISPLIHSHPLPYQYKGKVSEVSAFDNSKKITIEDGSIWRYAYPTDTDCKTPISKYPHLIPVENISCPVLLVCGSDDLLVNADFSVKLICDRLTKKGRGSLCSVLRYAGAGHIIEPPYTPLCYASYIKKMGEWSGDNHLVLGGEVKRHARAQEDAWSNILSFLKKNPFCLVLILFRVGNRGSQHLWACNSRNPKCFYWCEENFQLAYANLSLIC